MHTLGVRLDATEIASLTRAAEADDRTQSALARKVLVQWLREQGWLARLPPLSPTPTQP